MTFNTRQKELYADLESTLSDSRPAAYLLEIIDSILKEAKLDRETFTPELRDDVEVCMAALKYHNRLHD